MLPLVGEDELTIEDHVQIMANEINRADWMYPNADLLFNRQQRALAARFNDHKNKTTIELEIKYPWMKYPKMVCVDMLCRCSIFCFFT